MSARKLGGVLLLFFLWSLGKQNRRDVSQRVRFSIRRKVVMAGCVMTSGPQCLHENGRGRLRRIGSVVSWTISRSRDRERHLGLGTHEVL
uniref:Secreted protein n=1 Tax=Timema shepardi TaxID=629360 RepID=A0A7R9FWR4_TIMSH|nr:unnamed protein product [Timema shepardi]